MLEIKFVRENLDLVKNAMLNRGLNIDWNQFNHNDNLLKTLKYKLEELRFKKNTVSNKIAKMKEKGENIDIFVNEMREVSSKIKSIEKNFNTCESLLRKMIMSIPNIAHTSVPIGRSEKHNKIIKKSSGKRFEYNVLPPLPHWTVGENLGLFDLARASKIAGSRFPLFTGKGAHLERALINFMLDVHINEHGYYEILPPLIVNRRALIGTGQLPKFEDDLFKIEGESNFLIPTAEVPVTNMHQNEVLDESLFPISYVSYTPCFRSEAGSYGKDVRGIIRQHQFDKVELIKISLPDNSYDELELILKDAETILQRLELHYRVVNICTGDLGFSASKTYDLEVWMPSENKYIEISSCSNFESFQTRRANIRIKHKNRKGTTLAHTLNGSGLAVGRTMAAIIENYQQSDGSLIIPDVLRPYMGGIKVIDASNKLKSY